MDLAVGVVGLGVMGHNLALNIERHGFPVVAYDIDPEKTGSLLEGVGRGKNIAGVGSPSALVAALNEPRFILVMVPAGSAVDSAISQLKPHLVSGDILVDGGNSFFQDTERRNRELEAIGVSFIGTGVSGGEDGALWGPSLMPGGQRDAWEAIAPVLRAIAARADDGQPCVEYMGPRGAGHYVKMVHNGIEYGDMQLIAEIYDVLNRGLGLSTEDLQAIFMEWNAGDLKSYLMEITAGIFSKTDEETGVPLLDLVLDEAQQKGTGMWTSQNAMDVGAPVPTINAAVESRILSGLKAQRSNASKVLHGPVPEYRGDRQVLIDAAGQALYASKITSYAQGLGLLKSASEKYQYNLRLGEIAKVWRAGCIIRANLLSDIMAAYQRDPLLVNLLLDEVFRSTVERCQSGWRFLVQTAVGMGIPVLALGASLSYFDAYRSGRLPANLTQAQRDCFGAHTYRRTDREGAFHTVWRAPAGDATANPK